MLGALWPTGEAVIFPPVLGPYLAAIAQIGIVLYMFLVGLHLNPALFRGRTRAAVAVSHASIAVPFVLGTSLALVTYPQFSSSEVSFTSFALFSGVALSITAFPVLARILSDRRLHTSQLGAIALACAAADDVTAWCLLALVVGIAHAAVQRAVLTIVLALVYVAVMLLVGRPLVRRLVARFEHAPRMSSAGMSAIYIALLGSALATELIGIHALFGAFLVGAIVPPASRLARALCSRLEDLVTALLLPAFFAIAGLNTQIGLVDGASAWWTIALIIAAAFAGKFGGAFTAARLTGLGSAEAGALGIMMNTRGLMELIVLNIGLELGILSPVLYSMFVVMALATTLMTGPLLDALAPRITWSDGSMRERERVDAGRSALDPAALLDERAVAEHAGHHARADEDAHLELAGGQVFPELGIVRRAARGALKIRQRVVVAVLAGERQAQKFAQDRGTRKRFQKAPRALLHICEAAHGVEHHELVDRLLEGRIAHRSEPARDPGQRLLDCGSDIAARPAATAKAAASERRIQPDF